MLQEFYFYIDSAYQYGNGFPDEASRDAFNQEVTDLFRQAGWNIQKGKLSGECDYAVRDSGRESLSPKVFIQNSAKALFQFLVENYGVLSSNYS